MKIPKNIRIILTPVGQSERGDLEHIEGLKFNSQNALAKKLKVIVGEDKFEILTTEEFKTKCAFTKAANSFITALENNSKRQRHTSKDCYDLSEFMDDFNNQEFGGDTDKYWMGYVKLK